MKKSIKQLISEGESQFLELKREFNEGVLKTISAFANTGGGTLLIGVSDKKEVIGIEIKDNEFKDMVDKIVDTLGFHPEIEIVRFNNKKLVKIDVIKSLIPIKYKGIYYKRVGNTTREMNTDELLRFFRRDLRWERLINDKFTLNDIDNETVDKFVALSTAKGRLNLPGKDVPVLNILTMLGLVENNHFTNACVLLFGKNPQQFFPSVSRTRIVRLKDNITVISDKWISGNLFKQYYEVEEAIKSLINVRYVIKGFYREDIWDYPLPAIREAIANALVHRDYFEGREIQIKIYDDKIWFNNLGGLPEGLTLEELLSAHSSRPRNPLIANIFYISGIVESLGSGIERMRNALKEQNLPEPEIKANHVEFNLWFKKDKFTEEYLKSLGFNERQIKAVMFAKNHGKITNKEYRELVNLSDEGARLDLKGLVDRNIFVVKGKGRGLHYVINEFGN
jgi:ATP-dependent DNA helicase RecG